MTTIVLAAGRSQRFGHANKLLARVHGVPLIVLTLRRVLTATTGPVYLITGHQASSVRRALVRYGLRSSRLRIIYTRFARDGMAASLARGLAAAPRLSSALQIHLGDMPGIDRGLVIRLRRALNRGGSVVRPIHGGRPGHPVRLRRHVLPDTTYIAQNGLRGALGGLPDAEWRRVETNAHSVEDIDHRQIMRGLMRRLQYLAGVKS